jgi:hypothetical protein
LICKNFIPRDNSYWNFEDSIGPHKTLYNKQANKTIFFKEKKKDQEQEYFSQVKKKEFSFIPV